MISTGMLRLSTITLFKNNSRLFHKTFINNSKVVHEQPGRVSPFSVAGMFKHKELLPLVGIITVALGAISAYGVYFCNSRYDVSFWKKQPYESMDLLNPPVGKMKNTVDYRTYQPSNELRQLYQEMAEEEAKLKNKK